MKVQLKADTLELFLKEVKQYIEDLKKTSSKSDVELDIIRRADLLLSKEVEEIHDEPAVKHDNLKPADKPLVSPAGSHTERSSGKSTDYQTDTRAHQAKKNEKF